MRTRLLIGLAITATCVGCKPSETPVAPPPAPVTPQVLGEVPPPAPASLPAAAVPIPTKPVRLSLGTHLPQTGPDGLIILFSVEYRLAGELNSGSQYVWVIHRNQGGPDAEKAVSLQSEGTLQDIQSWRTEDGPFQSWIEERSASSRQEVSDRIDMLQ